MNSLFEGVPIFAGLGPAALETLSARAKQFDHPANAVVLREGESSRTFYLIGEGAVRVCKNFGQPAEVELARLGRGEFFCEMCILETLPRSATVQTVTPSTFFSLSSMDFLHLYNQMPREYGILVLNLARDLSRRLRRLDEVFAARH